MSMRTEPSFSTQDDRLDDQDLDNLDDYAELDDQDNHAEFSAVDDENRSFSGASSIADYKERYGLSMDPFVDDPHFPFYTGAQRRAVLDQVLHLCQFSKNLLVITGDYGVGKTRMAQALIDSLDDADDICFLESQVTSDLDSLLRDAAEQFSISANQLPDFYRRSSDEQGLVVMIVDNAHHLDDQVIADFVAQLKDEDAERLHIVLLAESHLMPRLERIDVDGVTLSDFHLEKFQLHEAVDYLNFRMEMADYLGPEIFTEATVEPWWREAQGQVLFLHEQAHERLLQASVATNQKREYKLPKPSIPMPHLIAASGLLTILILGYFYFGADSSNKKTVVQAATTSAAAQASVQSSLAMSSQLATPAPVVQSTDGSDEQTVSIPVPVQSSPVSSVAATAPASSVPVATQNQTAAAAPAVKERVVPLIEASAEATKPVVASSKAALATKSAVAVSSKAAAASIKDTPPAKELTTVKPVAKAVADSIEKPAVKSATGLSDQERTIMSWPDSEYTLQLVGVSSEKAATEFIAAQPNKKDLMLFRSKRAGKDWFVIVTGRFSTTAKARAALQDLPDAQKKAAPWPRDLKAIHNDIKNR